MARSWYGHGQPSSAVLFGIVVLSCDAGQTLTKPRVQISRPHGIRS
ncbi:hypothetical protein [Pectinatus frisingensis]|nr:hypothetical protein [Pectinatus frisingensis]